MAGETLSIQNAEPAYGNAEGSPTISYGMDASFSMVSGSFSSVSNGTEITGTFVSGSGGDDTIWSGTGIQTLIAEPGDAISSLAEASVPSIDEELVLTQAQELVRRAVNEWASDGLGEPGAHLADIRRRLAGI